MLQWWFAWHGIDPLRYAIWDPYDPYDPYDQTSLFAKMIFPAVA